MCEALGSPLDLVHATTGAACRHFQFEGTPTIPLLRPGPTRPSLASLTPTLKPTLYPSLLSLRSAGRYHANARFVGIRRRAEISGVGISIPWSCSCLLCPLTCWWTLPCSSVQDTTSCSHPSEIMEEACFKAMQRSQQVTQKRRKAFSSVGATEAEQFLQGIGIVEVNGNEEEPIVVPEGTPECSTFDFSIYPDENSGTPDLLKHHQTHLQQLGVSFGKSCYAMYDFHQVKDMYNFSTTTTMYSGGIDGGVAPFGLMSRSASSQCRVGYEHKQSAGQKLDYCRSVNKPVSTSDVHA